ncbi:DNA mismatch repair protein [Vallitalea pronyensis]|uniref:DNA mismatch repair protein n=1 Tax=Vallitalea pronyensis TaxID=1348613 RepID=A0A8J8MPX5_9FIRM|nr:MutS family DNA mismatch repair protein [Vallitalea pronyensis]QUI25208.1 DNA mismatch repair protein [Vallitalea pronyensis]
MSPKREYKNQRKHYEEVLEELKKRSNRYSNMRLILLLAGIIFALWMYEQKNYVYVIAGLCVTLVVFIGLVVMHHKVNRKKTLAQAMYDINAYGINHIIGQWGDNELSGAMYVDEHHAFSYDLDLFGKRSLFQWMNHTNTPIGEKKLRDALVRPHKTKENIVKRQEAVTELASKMKWVQNFRAVGMMEKKKPIEDETELIKWGKKVDAFYLKKPLKWFIRLMPFITIPSIIMAFIIPGIMKHVAFIAFLIQTGIVVFHFFTKSSPLIAVGNYRKQIQVYEQMIRLFEEETFETPLLQDLKRKLKYRDKKTASMQIKKLDQIMDMISLRYFQFYLLFDILTFWDYHCMFALEGWKAKYGQALDRWLDVLGELESLCSIATITYEQPQWVMPTIYHKREIMAEAMGHPLIHEEERVCNSVIFGKERTSLLITGSNMSGKSTFLRTIGINMILAYAGAPVCAQYFHCPIMDIYTSMRVKDDIDNKVSSFYAELIRIKRIIQAANEGKHIFYLLDEIFKGTNSRDRHIGAKTLIKKLAEGPTLGLVSTHDLELAELADEPHSKIANYHFQEFYKGDKIYFDYTLYPGVSDTFNAVYLMRQIGIHITK